MTMHVSDITVRSRGDGIMDLVLDRPAKKNALTATMIEDLGSRLDELRASPGLRVVRLRGAGGAFCAGADIEDWTDIPAARAELQSRRGREVFRRLAELPVPTIAVLEGPVLGGGLELALACDLRVAARNARLGMPEPSLGNLPSWGGVARLVDVAGLGVTRRMLLTAEIVGADRAAALGIVHDVVDDDRLDAATDALTERIAANDPASLALAKLVLAGFESDAPTESALAGLSALLEGSHERKTAFLAARAARHAQKAEVGR
ncbi:enoyl-CoA hydratase/carnithine racemase [Brooklawnia cerclae]|uniref:Enoyl-CoA hydratase/carnithine racemase n=2 Tax=Brooklawnia cerclae TaxID=349934 RepID=A0ABX0SBJ0_9ACTN|nr:enoyl-CoA hydratase/carnithine racemase [Brooklawnia cerclae]